MAEVTKMDVNINDKVALVTGGSKGIGLAVARALAKSGATVAIVARGAEALQTARKSLVGEGLNVRDYICDVSKASEIKTAFDKVVSDFGKIDILVNNAGTSRAMAFETVTDETWQADLDLKLFAAIRMCRLVWPGMKERRWGRIINVLNTAAKAPPAASAPTSVSRAAGMALTKVLAGEGGDHNILVNALLVGLIVSDQWVKRHAATAPNIEFSDFTRNIAKGVPLGRMGTAEEFANLACFLASDLSSYITGTAINVDGGRSPVV
jgi:3-oxoacyl-[acyl-carrier protein] reductase